MKIAVVAANGKLGQLIVAEAIKRGHEVTAFARSMNKTQSQHFIQKDIFDITTEDVKGFDALVSAYGITPESAQDEAVRVNNHISDILSGSKTKFYTVGGAGSLYVDEAQTTRLVDTPEFLDEWKFTALAQAEQLYAQRERDDVDWIFVSPAAFFDFEGEFTGEYQVAGDVLTHNAEGKSYISYKDFAYALLDVLESEKYSKQRISFLHK
ncbi:NAD(P)-dependent oxidoreductase [Alloscardovia venturai]|uniref:NAD(P)-dependent oxidoreductase n=1 Tax=Alloscardovia venturai TaxID=1769421 RepID=A0ABW2Y2H5_9BIFI